jgi:predicted O-methyltransferase YrrM
MAHAGSGTHSKSYFENDPRTKYCLDHSSELHPLQKKLMQSTLNHEMKVMLGAPDVMILCSNLIKLIGGKKVLDVGTFTGNSALAWALALPADGKVVTMDIEDEAYKKYGKAIIEESGVMNKIDFHFQPAVKTLDEMIKSGQSGTFDFAFIDADKESYQTYYEKCLTLLRPGGIVAVDNALWDNLVLLEGEKDEETTSIDGLNKIVKKDNRVNCTLLPIGDGLMLAFKKAF